MAEDLTKFRAVQFRFIFEGYTNSLLEKLAVIWGMDIWFSDLPLCKTIILANIIMWFLLWRYS
jgi:hypothetical protein